MAGLSSRTLVFIFGGAVLGLILFKDTTLAIIGGIIGGVISFIK